MEDYYWWTIKELREECDRRGLPTKGSKKELVERLSEVKKKKVEDTTWHKAKLEASDRVSAIENEWVAKTHVGTTQEQQLGIEDAIVEVAKKYRVPATILRKQVLWEAKAEPATPEEIEGLITGVIHQTT